MTRRGKHEYKFSMELSKEVKTGFYVSVWVRSSDYGVRCMIDHIMYYY